MATQPLSYRDVLERYDRAKAFGETRSLSEYSQHLNSIYGNNTFDAGARDGWWTRASTRVDQALQGQGPYGNDLTSAPADLLGSIGGAVGGLFGQEQSGTDIGRSLPRQFLDTAPLYLAPEASIPAKVLSYLGTGGLMGGHTYAETGSPRAGVISGVAGAALPMLGQAGGRLGSRLAGAEKVVGEVPTEGGANSVFNEWLPSTEDDAAKVSFGRFAGSQAAQIATNQASGYAQAKATGQEYDPTDKNFWLSQIPFTAFDAVHAVQHPLPTAESVRPGLVQPPAVPKEVTKPYVPQQGSEEAQQKVSEVLANAAAAWSDPTMTLEEKGAALNAALKAGTQPEVVRPALGNELETPPYPPMEGQPIEETPKVGTGGGELQTPPTMPLEGQPQETSITPEEVGSLGQMGVEPQKIARLLNTLPKSGNIVLDMFNGPVQEDAQGKVVRLGTTDVGEWMNPTRFQKATQVPKELLPAFQAMYPEAFNEKGEVNATALVKGLKERPMVEVKKLQGSGGDFKAAEMQHALDTERSSLTPEQIIEREFAIDRAHQNVGGEGEAQYSFLGPKPESSMPGYVEGLVRVPTKGAVNHDNLRDVNDTELYHDKKGVQFSGSHFGAEDTNVLAFYRGYEETLPDGRKAFHVIEVQSDWGQKVRNEQERYKLTQNENGTWQMKLGDSVVRDDQNNQVGKEFPTKEAAIKNRDLRLKAFGPESHPLLASYETLALKAAIDHARSIGADAIILSDGETAMMTEGHDKAALQSGEWGDQKPIVKQDAGMRLHYDTTLPSAMAKLTGDKGERVEVGQHEKSRTREAYTDAVTGEEKLGEFGSPVFRNPDGSPKTQISGRLFSLDKVNGGLGIDDTLSIKEAVAKFNEAQQKEQALRTKLATPSVTPSDILSKVGPPEQAKSLLEKELDSGATPEQATKNVELQTLTPQVDAAMKEQAVAKETVENILHPVQSLGRDKNFEKQHKYGPALKNKQGGRLGFPTQLEAEEHLSSLQKENAKDYENYRSRDGGANRGDRRWYLAPIENLETSLNVERGEEGNTLENVVGNTTEREQSGAQVLSAPTARKTNLEFKETLDAISLAERTNSDALHELVESDDPDMEISRAKQYLPFMEKAAREETPPKAEDVLRSVNKILRDNNLEPFSSIKDFHRAFSSVQDAARSWLDTLEGHVPSYVLGSKPEGDRELALQTGIMAGARPFVDWLAKQEFGPASLLIKAFQKFPELLDGVHYVLPEMKGHNPAFSSYFDDSGTFPIIHVRAWPTQENLSSWAGEQAHELAHYMERELSSRDDPSAKQYKQTRTEILKALRNSKQLPQDVKDLVRIALKENHYFKFQSARDDEVQDTWLKVLGAKDYNQKADLVYALLNEDEMVASMFSSPRVVALMRTTDMPRSKVGLVKTVLDWFGDAWSKLVGGKEEHGTALAQLLNGFDNYLTGGILRKTFNGAYYIRGALIREGVTPDTMAARMRAVDRTFTRGDLRPSIVNFTDETGKEVNPELRKALLTDSPSSVHSSGLNLLMDDLPFHQDLLNRLQKDIAIATELHARVKDGRLPGTVPDDVGDKLVASKAKVNALKRALQQQAKAVETAQNLDNFTPEGFAETQIAQLYGSRLPAPPDQPMAGDVAQAAMGLRDLGEVKTETSRESLEGKTQLPWLLRTLGMTQYVKKLVPAFRPVADDVRRINGDMSGYAHAMNLAYNSKDGVMSKSVADANDRVARPGGLNRAASELAQLINVKQKKDGVWSWDDDDLKGVLNRFSTSTSKKGMLSDRDALTSWVEASMQRKGIRDVALAQGLQKINQEYTALAMSAKETGMLPDSARDLTQKVYTALNAIADPAQAVVGQQMLADLAKQMSPDTFLDIIKMAQGMTKDVNNFFAFQKTQPFNVTEQRYDKFHARMLGPDGQVARYQSATKDGLLKIVQEKERAGYKFQFSTEKADANTPSGGVSEEWLAKARELDAQAMARLSSILSPEMLEQVMPAVNRSAQVEAAMKAFEPIPGPTRKFIEGREGLDMVNNDSEFTTRSLNWIRHKLIRSTSSLNMLHPEIAGNTELKKYSEQHVANYLTPDNPIVTKLNSVTYFTRLAWNMGNMALEGMQNLTTIMQSMIAETGSVGDAYGLWGNAVKELAGHKATGKWSSPEMQWFMDKTANSGFRNLTTWNDIIDPETEAVVRAQRAGVGKIEHGFNVAQSAYKKFGTYAQRFNDNLSLVAGFNLGLEKGMTKEQAMAYALDVKERGAYTGGKGQRPVGLWSIKTKPVPQLMSALQTYTVGWFNQMATDFKIGWGKAPSHLTETQKSGSRKAFIYGLASQAVLAGALGMPGMGQGAALLQQTTGLDLKGWLRKNLASLFDEDQDNGGLLTDLAMRGPFGVASGVDTSNRAAISVPFIGVDPYKGFDISQLAGATGSSVQDWIQGSLALMKGDKQGYQKLLPGVLKGPYSLMQGDGDVRDARGTLMYQLSPAEKVMSALGLTPSRVQNQKDIASTVKIANQTASREKESLADEVAGLLRAGKQQEAQQRNMEVLHDHPEYVAQNFGVEVADRFRAQTQPYDWRRELNPGAQIGNLVSRNPSTELQGRQAKANALSMLGFSPRPDMRGDAQAAEMDALINSNPYLTPAEARKELSRKRPSLRQNTLPSYLGLQ